MKDLFCVAVLLVVLCWTVDAASNDTVTPVGPPVQCYKCSSHPDEDGEACYDPINTDVIGDSKLVTCPSGICLKYVQNIENEVKQIDRGCADAIEPVLTEKEKPEGCVLSTGTKSVQLQICNCKSEGCNGGAEVRSITSLVMAAGLLSVAARLLH